MEQNTLYLIFENSNGGKSRLKINDVRPNLTSQEVAALGSKIVDKNAIVRKSLLFVQYLNSELETTTVSIL